MAKMNSETRAAQRIRAREILISIGGDWRPYEMIGDEGIKALSEHAHADGYRQPRGTNGCRLRCYFAWLERLAGGGAK